MSDDSLQRVTLDVGSAFPADRAFALLDRATGKTFDPTKPAFNHKSNFACAFTECEKLSQVSTSFDEASNTLMANTTEFDLRNADERNQCAAYFGDLTGRDLELVTSSDGSFQFGNTQSGINYDGDSRTIHVVNAATVREFNRKTSRSIRPERFRPNIIIDGFEPFEEFKWVDDETPVTFGTCTLLPIKRTVRCAGINVDPESSDVFDVATELNNAFPEHGPYFGVYCKVVESGEISVGDKIECVNDKPAKVSPWLRTSIDFENDNVTVMLVDFLVLLSITFYVKIISITSSLDFLGWDAAPQLHSLPSTLANAAALTLAWTLANLRDNGWASNLEDTRLGRMGSIGRKGGGYATSIALATANLWVIATLFVAVFQHLGLDLDETGLALTVALLLPSMVVERLLLFYFGVR
ncbi:hypothetical protein TL16_g02410 [Triparma laevis f. inornata]|uniref:MOSC domain-containing protein n=1 Tax=Triparma laevis f. inornata TaxID=1714386 RepID=A0A9W7DV73_9STRA|nr:hypothetical protein TL16_g02410 [Triparma laevis f. inornata]